MFWACNVWEKNLFRNCWFSKISCRKIEEWKSSNKCEGFPHCFLRCQRRNALWVPPIVQSISSTTQKLWAVCMMLKILAKCSYLAVDFCKKQNVNFAAATCDFFLFQKKIFYFWTLWMPSHKVSSRIVFKIGKSLSPFNFKRYFKRYSSFFKQSQSGILLVVFLNLKIKMSLRINPVNTVDLTIV